MTAAGRVKPGGGEEPARGPRPLRGGELPAAGAKGGAAVRQGATKGEDGQERAGPPLSVQPLGQGHIGSTEGARRGDEVPWRDTEGLREGGAED